MTPEIGLVTVIGLVLTLAILIFKHMDDKAEALKKELDDKDKEIDSISNGDDVTRIADELRNK